MKRQFLFTLCVVLALALATLLLGKASPVYADLIWQIQTVDSVGAGDVGQNTSLALDSAGNPVISYWDVLNGDLKLVHCGDANCTSGNSMVTVDSAGNVGRDNSLALDSSGYPVISYSDSTNSDLKLVHCGDANCTSGNSLVTVDSAGMVGFSTSLALDGSGNPVISYYDGTNGDLKLAHCGDVNCTNGNSLVTVDSAGYVGYATSLALDGSGNPVISYQDGTNHDLKLAHCGDANCSSGNSLVTVDSATMVGPHTSLALDSNGNPLISYEDFISSAGKLAHCGDANCSSGNSIVFAGSGDFSSLALDSVGNPVISYESSGFNHLMLVHCANAICSGTSSIATVDADGQVGWYTSLALDSLGTPVISYYDLTNDDLKLAHCSNANCSSANSTVTVDNGGADRVGQYTSLALDSVSNPVISYYNSSSRDLKLAHCGSADCSSGNSIVTVDSAGDVGWYTSLALDSAGNPVISYWDATNRDLKLAHCGNADCTSGNSIVSLDSAGNVGWFTSLALDSAGNPVISYQDIGNGDLKLVHCGDANCTSGNSIVTVDSAGSVGFYISLALDGNGYPVISYHDNVIGDLKLAHCGDANCTSGNNIVTVDSAGYVGTYTSLALDSIGNPVISYHDATTGFLKLAHCGDANCTSDNSIVSLGSGGFVGDTSLALDSNGRPVISFAGGSNYDLQLAQCGDANCTSGNRIVTVDSVGIFVDFTSLTLDGRGNPVISYHDLTNGDLKLARLVNTDTTPPSVTLNQAAGQADPTASSPINFTVYFGEPVTGFTAADVTLSGTAGANTAVVSEIPPNDGTTYDVAISGMTTSGTVIASISGGVALDAAGNPNTASTSTDDTVTFMIDSTPPLITPSIVGISGNNGWYVSDVTVIWSVVDNESLVSSQTGCDSTTLSSDTDGTTLTCSATSEGGTTSRSVTVKLDKTAPTVDAGPAVSILQGGTYAGMGTFSDPSAAPWTATVDYSDGSGVQSLTLVGNTFTLNHVYTAAGIFTVEVSVIDDAGNVGTASIEVTMLTPQEGIAGLIDQVQALIPGTLNGGQGHARIAKLEAAIQQLDRGNVATAINQLEAFINEVNADISTGKLTLEEGQPLLDAANVILAALGH